MMFLAGMIVGGLVAVMCMFVFFASKNGCDGE